MHLRTLGAGLAASFVLILPTAANAAPKDPSLPPYGYASTDHACDAVDGSTCAQSLSADAKTGTLRIAGSVTSPDQGLSPGEGLNGFSALVGRSQNVSSSVHTVTATANVTIDEASAFSPGPLSSARIDLRLDLVHRASHVTCVGQDSRGVVASVAGPSQQIGSQQYTLTSSIGSWCQKTFDSPATTVDPGQYSATVSLEGKAILQGVGTARAAASATVTRIQIQTS